MAQSSGEPKFSLRLILDEEKNKVVLAEACRDFVDVLFSLLTLPLGTIVILLEKHRDSEIGCLSNLYKCLVSMGIDDFETEACKQILLNPRSVKEAKCKRLKLNMNPTDDLRFFQCTSTQSCLMFCSNFSTTRCKCGNLITKEMRVVEGDQVADSSIQNGVFVSSGSSFIITDDLKVEVRSTEIFFEKLKSVGCADVRKLHERLLDIGFEEVMTLLLCIFYSNTPLTDAFLNKGILKRPMTLYWSLGQCIEKRVAKPEKVVTLKAIVRKHDMKILYVECGEDFVDLLFTFLAVPFESVMELSGHSSTIGCIGNLFKSYKDLSATTTKSMLHHYYKYQKQLLYVITDHPPLYYRYNLNQKLKYSDDKVVPVVLIDPKSHGFMKRDTKFTVSHDLIITPMNSSSTFRLLRKLQVQAKDLVVQEICITETEASSLLNASLVESSPLNSALWNLIANAKKPKEEEP